MVVGMSLTQSHPASIGKEATAQLLKPRDGRNKTGTNANVNQCWQLKLPQCQCQCQPKATKTPLLFMNATAAELHSVISLRMARFLKINRCNLVKGMCDI